MTYVTVHKNRALFRRFILTPSAALTERRPLEPPAGAAVVARSRPTGCSQAPAALTIFTFSLPAVREVGFKWQVTYNFEARLLVIPAPGFIFARLTSPARWNAVRATAALDRVTIRSALPDPTASHILARPPRAAICSEARWSSTGGNGRRPHALGSNAVTLHPSPHSAPPAAIRPRPLHEPQDSSGSIDQPKKAWLGRSGRRQRR